MLLFSAVYLPYCLSSAVRCCCESVVWSETIHHCNGLCFSCAMLYALKNSLSELCGTATPPCAELHGGSNAEGNILAFHFSWCCKWVPQRHGGMFRLKRQTMSFALMNADYGEFGFLFLCISSQNFPADIHLNCLAKMVLFHLCNVCKRKKSHLITLLAFYLWCLLPPEIETVKLARLVFSKLHEICSNWVKDFPLQPKPHRYYETSIHAIKNMRRKMEDKHVCIPDFNMLFNLEVKWDSMEGKYMCWIQFTLLGELGSLLLWRQKLYMWWTWEGWNVRKQTCSCVSSVDSVITAAVWQFLCSVYKIKEQLPQTSGEILSKQSLYLPHLT